MLNIKTHHNTPIFSFTVGNIPNVSGRLFLFILQNSQRVIAGEGGLPRRKAHLPKSKKQDILWYLCLVIHAHCFRLDSWLLRRNYVVDIACDIVMCTYCFRLDRPSGNERPGRPRTRLLVLGLSSRQGEVQTLCLRVYCSTNSRLYSVEVNTFL